MHTSSGITCDVCGKYILPIIGDDKIISFNLTIAPGHTFHCDPSCRDIIVKAENRWESLPVGPLRELFERAEREQAALSHEAPATADSAIPQMPTSPEGEGH